MSPTKIAELFVDVLPQINDGALRTEMNRAIKKAEANASASFELIADVSGAIKSIDKVSKSVKDVTFDVKADTSAATEGLGDVEDAAFDAKAEIVKLQEQIRDMANEAAKSTSGIGKDLGDSFDDGSRRAGEGLDSIRDEADGTSREVAASFDGSTESILGGFQELTANAFAGFGPAGAAAGAVVALAMGTVFSSLQKNADKAAEVKQRIIELAREITEAGGDLDQIDFADKMRDWGDEIKDAKSWWEPWQKDTITNFEDMEKKASKFDVTMADLFKGMSGSDSDAAMRSMDEINGLIADQDEILADLNKRTDLDEEGRVRAATAASDQKDALKGLREELQDSAGITDAAIDRHKRMEAILGPEAAKQEALKLAQEAQTAAVEEATEKQQAYQDLLVAAADPVTAYADIMTRKTEEMRLKAQEHADSTKESTGQAADSWEDYATDVVVTMDDLIADLNDKIVTNAAFEANLKTLGEKGMEGLAEELRKGGPEANAETAAALALATDAQMQTYADERFAYLGKAAGDSLAAGAASKGGVVQESVTNMVNGVSVPTLTVPVDVNLTEAEKKMAAFKSSITSGDVVLNAEWREKRGDVDGTYRGTNIGGNAYNRIKSIMPGNLRVSSMYRSPAQNRAAGGVPNSLHMDRNNPAVDIAGSTPAMDRFANQLRAMGGWRQLLYRVAGHYDHIHVAHQGGLVDSSWGQMPGLRTDERPVIAQTGERILSRTETRTYDSGAGGGNVIVQGSLIVRERADASRLAQELDFKLRTRRVRR